MTAQLAAADARVAGGDPRNVYRAGLNTTRLLMALGDVVCAWLLLRQAEVSTARLDEGVASADRAFYEGKVAAASFFARTVLPGLAADRQVAEATDLAVMDVDDSGF